MTASVLCFGLAMAWAPGVAPGPLGPTPVALDTTWTVRSGDRLEIENFAGEVLVDAWDRDEVSVRVAGVNNARFQLRQVGGAWRMGPARGWNDDEFTYSITVPRTMPVDVRGNELAVQVSGLDADVIVSTVDGDIEIERVRGQVEARSLDGTIRVSDVEGRVQLFALDDGVRVTRVTGPVHVETTDGDLVLRDIDSRSVSGSTVDGDIDFRGPVHPDGRYELVTHDGDIDFGVVGELNARMHVSLYDGEMVSDFPVMLSRMQSDREMEFTLAEGSAEVRLAAFDGTVRLLRANAPEPR